MAQSQFSGIRGATGAGIFGPRIRPFLQPGNFSRGRVSLSFRYLSDVPLPDTFLRFRAFEFE